jgi:PAS domain-containing protein
MSFTRVIQFQVTTPEPGKVQGGSSGGDLPQDDDISSFRRVRVMIVHAFTLDDLNSQEDELDLDLRNAIDALAMLERVTRTDVVSDEVCAAVGLPQSFADQLRERSPASPEDVSARQRVQSPIARYDEFMREIQAGTKDPNDVETLREFEDGLIAIDKYLWTSTCYISVSMRVR